MADGTEYTIELAAKVLGLDSASAKLSTLEASLNSAGEASKVAEAALADGEKKYTQLERAATMAAKALERAGAKTSGAVPADLAQKAQAAQTALAAEAKTLDQLRSKAAAAAAEHQRLSQAFKTTEQAAKKEVGELNAANKAARGSKDFGAMAGALGALGGPLGMAGQRVATLADGFVKLGQTMGTGPGAIAAGVVALSAAVVALAAAVGYAIVKTAIWAVGLADARREAGLNIEAIEQTSAALGGLSDILPDIQSATGLANDKIADLARQLADAKVSADDMPAALKAAATAESALAGEGAKLVAELKAGKKSVTELAREAESKFGGIVQKKLIGLSAQSNKLKQNLSDTFGGLEIDPLLEGISKLVDLFDKSSASGQTLKFLFEKFFQPLVDAASKSIPVVEAFLLGLAIGALKVYIAFKPAAKAIASLFKVDSDELPDALSVAKNLGEALGEAIGYAAVAVALLVAAVGTLVAPLVKVYDAGKKAWDGLSSGLRTAIETIKSFSLYDTATNLIAGLVSGIKASASRVVDALGGVVKDAIASAKKLLGIASPSKVFAEIGENVGAGFGGGVEDSSGDAQRALEGLVSPPALPAAAGASVSGGGHTFSIHINAPSGNANEIASVVEAVLTRILQGDLTQLEPEPT